jgi:thiosulfate reductase/polysulfide reductase chain A
MEKRMDRRSFMKVMGATGAVAASGYLALPLFRPSSEGPQGRFDPGPLRTSIDYDRAKAIPTVCFGCTTHCGVLGWVEDGRVRRISGNPLDPNAEGRICGKAQGMVTYTYYPERILYPLKRVGKRGEGKWKRISWGEALDEIAGRLHKLREAGTPEQFVFHYGRDKTKGFTKRFTEAYGTPHRLNRRAICSSNRRVPLMSHYGRDFEWGTQDFERTQFIVNFGCNPMEAFQGGQYMMPRIQKARVDHGAKMVTFEVRPSATASVSDEYFPIKPGTDGAVALAMAHVIGKDGSYDEAFWNRWANYPLEDMLKHIEQFTPEWAEKESGIPAEDIRRIARAFAAAAPACCTLSGRGSAKHYNGAQSDRGIRLLDVLVGNVGKPGGYCLSSGSKWGGKYGQDGLPKTKMPGPSPAKTKAWLPGTREFETLPKEVQERVAAFPEFWQKKYFGELATPSEYPLAWHWYQMRVGQLVYPYIQEGRQKVDLYMSYTLGASYGYPEANVARETLLDEEKIPFHVAIDISYGEQAALADIILPDATSLERWDYHGTNAYGLVPYVGLRQPLVEPLGEARSVQVILRDLARRIGGGMEAHFDFEDPETFYKEWYKELPISWEEFKRRGIWYDKERPLDYELYERPIAAANLEGSEVDPETQVVYNTRKGKRVAVGIMQGEQAVQGFPTPTRKIQVYDDIFQTAAAAVGVPLDDPVASPIATYFRVPAHVEKTDDQLFYTTFKWNVHTQGRTGHLKYQAEIVHDNPIWIHPETAQKQGLDDGDQVELTVYRPHGYTYRAGEEEPVGSFVQRIKYMHGMQPGVVCTSHHVGHWEQGPVGADAPTRTGAPAAGFDPELADRDVRENMWWAKQNGGVGSGVHTNDAMPIDPAPLIGGQNWFDNVCRIKKV